MTDPTPTAIQRETLARLRQMFASRADGPALWLDVPLLCGDVVQIAYDPHGAAGVRGLDERLRLSPDDLAEIGALFLAAAAVANEGFSASAAAA